MIAVMGASGNTGKKIAASLLAAGKKVRVIGRSENKLAALVRAGAEAATGDVRDPAFLARAFRGVEAAYVLLAADATAGEFRAEQDRMGAAIAQAIDEARVARVVALSSLGAELADGNGPISGLHAQEERLRGLAATEVLALRPAWFFENFATWLPLIKAQGIAGDSLAPDRAIPMVGTDDIATAAVAALTSRAWRGFAVRELLGPRDLSATEVARLLGKKIGKPELPYVQFSDAETETALAQVGLSASFARQYTEMTRALNAGRLQPAAGRTTENTTATDFERYAGELAAIYASGA